jgi:hypothetical protein
MQTFKFKVALSAEDKVYTATKKDSQYTVTWKDDYGIRTASYRDSTVEWYLKEGKWLKVAEDQTISFSEIRKGDKIRVEFKANPEPHVVEAVADNQGNRKNEAWYSSGGKYIVSENAIVSGGGSPKITLLERKPHPLENLAVGALVAFWKPVDSLSKYLYLKTGEDTWSLFYNGGKYPTPSSMEVSEEEVTEEWDRVSVFEHELIHGTYL